MRTLARMLQFDRWLEDHDATLSLALFARYMEERPMERSVYTEWLEAQLAQDPKLQLLYAQWRLSTCHCPNSMR